MCHVPTRQGATNRQKKVMFAADLTNTALHGRYGRVEAMVSERGLAWDSDD